MKKKYFNAIQFIRLFAFLNIFLLHAKSYRVTGFPENAAWAVSFFFMISGFLNGYKYYNLDVNIKDTLKFTIQKFLKFYFLYFIMTILMIPFSGLFMIGRDADLAVVLKKIFYNLFLVQSFSFDRTVNYALTGVGWFLSTFMFLVFITIPLISLLKKITPNKGHKVFLIIILIIFGFVYTDAMQYIKAEASYFVYVFPPARIFEYASAILLGFLMNDIDFSVEKPKKTKVLYTVLELSILIALPFLFVIVNKFPYYSSSAGWMIPNLLLIAIFTKEYGYITKILGNKFFVHLGTLTLDAYLIHEVLIMYVYIIPGINNGIRSFEKVGVLIFLLFTIFLLSEFIHKNNVFDKINAKILNYF